MLLWPDVMTRVSVPEDVEERVIRPLPAPVPNSDKSSFTDRRSDKHCSRIGCTALKNKKALELLESFSLCTLSGFNGSDGLGTLLGCSSIMCIPEFDFGNAVIQNLIQSYLLWQAIKL